MAQHNVDRVTIRQYLLGTLSAELQQKLEERLLTEAELLEELEIEEDQLIDEYLGGNLAEAEGDRFDRHFLSTPERRRKLQFSSSLNRYVSANRGNEGAGALSRQHLWTTQKWALPAAAAFAVVVIVAAIFWPSRPSRPSTPTFATINLSISSSNRADPTQAKRLTLPLNADAIRLRMKLPEGAEPGGRYRVELRRENRETQVLPTLGQDEQSVVAEIVAAELSRGQYALNLYVVKPDGTEQRIRGSYFFTVE